MAIKIIGNRTMIPIYFGECMNCGGFFEFEHSDANEHFDSPIEGFHYNVTCPHCNKRVWVKRKIYKYK